jgi:hypothetical protein
MRDFQTIYGVDFSGAQDAVNTIWISRGVPNGKRLLIQECFRARYFENLRHQPSRLGFAKGGACGVQL